ncbi:hypothetical protein H7F50_06290 [Novosphingobium flavum]|uniref:hypothetical protein n=1 Tax=Novosphingobium aerophilum TaxID=2839843 RepID=UPI00163B4114|nr:hypothetical protein [Novosphingobium aerophilum]MBC2661358.1 hypothetical protein [Novosphingobium aerophilum]
MTISPIDAVALVAVGFGLFAYWLLSPAPKADQPGPHNNWRRISRAGDGSSFDETGGGFGAGDGGGDH